MKLKISSEGMARRNNGRSVRTLPQELQKQVLLEYLFYSEAVGAHLLYHKQDYIKQRR
ncbi:hypothetical protein M1N86_00735 [Dehalococcoidia bacterium]|nr:hypothetical protein [Dehalococcoidia bacterium]